MIKIDKGIPVPPRMPRGARSKYPFLGMEVGDSFFVPGIKPRQISPRSCSARLRAEGAKFATRSVTENGVDGTRVWRVE